MRDVFDEIVGDLSLAWGGRWNPTDEELRFIRRRLSHQTDAVLRDAAERLIAGVKFKPQNIVASLTEQCVLVSAERDHSAKGSEDERDRRSEDQIRVQRYMRTLAPRHGMRETYGAGYSPELVEESRAWQRAQDEIPLAEKHPWYDPEGSLDENIAKLNSWRWSQGMIER